VRLQIQYEIVFALWIIAMMLGFSFGYQIIGYLAAAHSLIYCWLSFRTLVIERMARIPRPEPTS
jgi:hypothetical protein